MSRLEQAQLDLPAPGPTTSRNLAVSLCHRPTAGPRTKALAVPVMLAGSMSCLLRRIADSEGHAIDRAGPVLLLQDLRNPVTTVSSAGGPPFGAAIAGDI